MIFVLCSDYTYGEMYERESYKYVRIVDHRDLVGFPKVNVVIHDCWMYSFSDDRVEYLEQQLVTLADFGCIKLSYQSEDGDVSLHFTEIDTPVENTQQDFLSDSPSVVAYETVDTSCEGGACTI